MKSDRLNLRDSHCGSFKLSKETPISTTSRKPVGALDELIFQGSSLRLPRTDPVDECTNCLQHHIQQPIPQGTNCRDNFSVTTFTPSWGFFRYHSSILSMDEILQRSSSVVLSPCISGVSFYEPFFVVVYINTNS